MLAALAASLNALVGDGRWGPISTCIFPFVAAIPMAYVWPSRTTGQVRLRPPEVVALWSALTLVWASAFGWPAQLIVDKIHTPALPSDAAFSDNSLPATLVALVFAALLVAAFLKRTVDRAD